MSQLKTRPVLLGQPLARILLEAGLVGADALAFALDLSLEKQYSLGKILTRQFIITPHTRRAALNAILFVGSKTLTQQHAVAALKASFRSGKDLPEIVGQESWSFWKLANDMVESGIFSENEVLDIVEHTIEQNAMWSWSPSASSAITASLKLEATTAIQEKLARGSMDANLAMELCKQFRLSAAFISDCIKSAQESQVRNKPLRMPTISGSFMKPIIHRVLPEALNRGA
ncbi:MAG: hypothetical protein K2X77_05745 [Candidatus Obscuribacterales bacterium]|jgi:hypothetical protein|nr:hypothetical protein [Candidatus Obscuribacterales bacterium]